MIIPLIETTGVVAPETGNTTEKDDKSNSVFTELFSSVTQENTGKAKTDIEAVDDEANSDSLQEKDANELPWMTMLEQLSQFMERTRQQAAPEQLGQFMELIRQQAAPEQEEAVASAIDTIIGVLEGNDVSGDTDIAALLTEIQSCFEQLGSEGKEAILARMPQEFKLFQEPNSAATEDTFQRSSNLCPLENSSEPSQAPGMTLSRSDAQQNVGVISDENPEQTATVETAPDDGVKEKDRDSSQAEGLSSRSVFDVDENSSTASTEYTAVKTQDSYKVIADNTLSKLTDILASYDEQGNNRFEIQLEPENLGKLSITLTMSEDGLKALIGTKDAQVHSLLTSEINALVEKLRENGVQIKSLDVICTNMGGQQLGDQHSDNAYSGRDSAQYGGRQTEDIQTAYEESNSTQLYAWVDEELIGCTVSYRA